MIVAIDWSKPIEAVHEDGRVRPVQYDGLGENGHMVAEEPVDCAIYFNDDGSPSGDTYPGWRIRNVQPTTSERDPDCTHPKEGSPGWQRMVALCRDAAINASGHIQSEALSILRDIASDEVREARAVCAEASIRAGRHDQADEYRIGRWDGGYTMDVAKLAFRRGRELSRQGDAA